MLNPNLSVTEYSVPILASIQYERSTYSALLNSIFHFSFKSVDSTIPDLPLV